ncbi:cytochrome P450 [Stereum hirsutum FP-91666 SS1]|uniref:cytochrome P450 n=1 Tax=Stereum hirsutum (strain FP-91666) TaxID=721885 RepID=UPI0004449298|nr:cytochrome P450 [Stereum hirsutum FP-91666 SS1]EIM84826.1 cytochrome P450 [Stereum hirsutum FP-91666 SS1]
MLEKLFAHLSALGVTQYRLKDCALAGTYALGLVLIVRRILMGNRGSLPPGPKGWPIIKNILDIPAEYQWKTFLKWSREYRSDVISLKVPGATLVVLNTMKAVDDLMVKRSHIYSSRPRMVMLNEVTVRMRHDWIFGIMPYGDRWRASRKLFSQYVDKNGIRPHQLTAVRRFLPRLLATGSAEDLDGKLRLVAGDFILSSAYGLDIRDADNHFVRLSQDALMSIIPGVHLGGYVVDIFPMLKHLPAWFPGAGFQRIASKSREMVYEARHAPFKFAQEQMEKGTAKPSLTSALIQSLDKDKTPDYDCRLEAVQDVFATMYLAGSETTIIAMRNFIVAVAAFPLVLKKGQMAVDSFLDGRLPTFEDRKDLPYVDALVEETLRWGGFSFIGVPHCTSEDDYYNGYFIPKGALVLANIWAVLQDENIYGPKTERFQPERFLYEDGTFNAEIDADPEFGFGRRVCPGKDVVREALWILIASFLAVFDIHDAVGEDGKPIDVDKIANLRSKSTSFLRLLPHD